MRGSTMQLSFSNKVSAIPQFLSFKSGVEEKPRKTTHDHISSGFSPISTADAFDSNQNPYSCMIHKNMIPDKQGAKHYAVQHFDAYPVHRPQQMRIFPVSNHSQTITACHFASSGQNVGDNSLNSQSVGRVPIISSVSVHPTPSSIVRTTELRNVSKSSVATAQLTIFYAGSVCVYDDICPEKAQAIMLLAGHGSSVTQDKTVSPAQVQAPIQGPSAYVGNKTHTCSGLPSPIAVTSTSNNELATVKLMGPLASTNNSTEPPKTVGSSSATLIPTVAAPQARKASLARFLEKRKERGPLERIQIKECAYTNMKEERSISTSNFVLNLINASAYNASKKSPI
ncbi:hypothetical protein MANES_14G172400v8 [Manihot esculenta]|nr:hypothetical protein MANES_14G172400v8 [Manihot esculenta]KAG8639834.1 hypothetical protein MANES_14G172400v8 [Manihot esculenta]